jgi:guanylate kinase
LRGKPFIFSAPSGTGKTTITRALLARFDHLVLSVSTTTRSPRGAEEDGVAYHFVDRTTFEARVAAGQMLEWAEVHGNLYGTDAAFVEAELAAGHNVLFDIDVQGGHQLRDALPESVLLFLLPPSYAELERRLRARGTDSDLEIERRLGVARAEARAALDYDVFVVNDALDSAIDRCAEVLCSVALEKTGLATAQAFVNTD